MNLKTNRVSTHFFDSPSEVNPADNQVSEIFDVQFEDNLTFSSNSVRYRILTPTSPSRVLDFNMGTKRTAIAHSEHITNCLPGRGADTLMCEKVDMPMRDGVQVPVVLVYDKRFYTEDSPWVLFTRGIHSTKEDLALTPGRLSLTDRGLVCAYPMNRGKLGRVTLQALASLTMIGSCLVQEHASTRTLMTSSTSRSSQSRMS